MMLLSNHTAFVAKQEPAEATRRGYSLIEMLAAITLSALVLGIAVTVLMKFDRQERQSGLRYKQTSDLMRLADQFRADVHAATSVADPQYDAPAEVVVVCHLPGDSQVEYRRMKQHLVRVTSDSQGNERQERFLFTPVTEFTIEKTAPAIVVGSPPEPIETDRGQFVKLIVRWPMNGQQHDTFRQLPIIAQIGRDLPVRIVPAEVRDATP